MAKKKQAVANTAPTAREVMALLADIAREVAFAAQPNARAIGFDLDGELFTLDPARREGMLVAGAVGSPALIIRCRPLFLYRLLVQEGVTFEREDEVRVVGDPDALKPLIAALRSGTSLLAVRTRR